MTKITPLNYKKHKIPKALREQLWIHDMGSVFNGKCLTPWCKNQVTVFDFHAGHRIPESKGGPTTLDNLVVICSRCNLSMGSTYTFTEWSRLYVNEPSIVPIVPILVKQNWFRRLLCLIKY